jgi:hypothetical protein
MTRAGVAYYEREQRDLVRINYVEPTRRRCRRGPRRRARARRIFRRADRRVGARGARRRAAVPARVVDDRGDRAGAPVEPLARYFEYWLLRLQGVYPSLDVVPGARAAPRRRGDAAAPTICSCAERAPRRAAHGGGIDGAEVPQAAGATAPERIDTLPLQPRAARELEMLHRRLLHLHLEKELKSARVLREMRHAR